MLPRRDSRHFRGFKSSKKKQISKKILRKTPTPGLNKIKQISTKSKNPTTIKGLGKLLLNEDKISQDLEDNWAVTAEAIQTVLRRERFEKPYEALKAFTRGAEVNKELMKKFIESLNVTEAVKTELGGLDPHKYGAAALLPGKGQFLLN